MIGRRFCGQYQLRPAQGRCKNLLSELCVAKPKTRPVCCCVAGGDVGWDGCWATRGEAKTSTAMSATTSADCFVFMYLSLVTVAA